METDLYLYEVVSAYIQVIQHDSPEAAAVVEEIRTIYGSRAALHATLVITLLKMEVQKSRSEIHITVQMHLLNDFPEALPLMERAITYCVQAWGIRYAKPRSLANSNHAGRDGETASSALTLPPY